jgi:hypothetical protein
MEVMKMALVHIGYRIRDADGDKSTMAVKVPRGALTLAQIEEFAQEFSVLLNAVIDGVIEAMNVSISMDLPGGLRTTPVANCEVQKGALLSFTANGTEYRYSVRVPSYVPGKFSGNEVDTADVEFIAIRDALVSGLDATGTQVQPCDEYENDLLSFIEGRKSFRRK